MKSRWKAGRRAAHYKTLDPEGGVYDAAETAARVLSDQRIIAAAAQSGGNNWLREDENGVLLTPNAPIPITRQAGYRRDPSTFDAAFRRQASRVAPPPARNTASQAPSAPTAIIPSSNVSVPAARAPSSRTRIALAAPPAVPTAPPRVQRQRKAQKASKAENGDALRSVSFKLPMIHGTDVEIEDRRLALRVDGDSTVKSVNKASPLYEHGGALVRVWDSENQRYGDVILCDPDICSECHKTGKSGQVAIKVQHSPTEGLPFVHIGQDTKKNEKNEYVFRQTGPASIAELVLPEDMQTAETKLWCQSGGEAKLVRVLGCIAKTCTVCTPTRGELDSDDDSETEGDLDEESSIGSNIQVGGGLQGEDNIGSDGEQESGGESEESDSDEEESEPDDGEIEDDGDEYRPAKRQRIR